MISAQGLKRAGSDPSTAIVLLITILGAIWSLFAAAYAPDAAMRGQSWLILGGFLTGIFLLVGSIAGGGVITDEREYNENLIKAGVIASLFWGVAGLLVGVVIAFQLAFPVLNIEAFGFTNFGRLRPLHTSAVIFAFGGNALIATSFYVVQRTCRTRIAWRDLALVRVLGISILHPAGRFGLSDRDYPGQGIRRAGMVCRYLADHRLGRLSRSSSSARCGSARNRISMWRTGSSWPSSSRSRSCM